MKGKKPRPTDGGGNWMDTYGDMVTLLMTFFVMLFAMSNLNEQKWEVFVRSIYPNSSEVTQDQVALNAPIGEADAELTGSLEIPETDTEVDIDKLYLTLAERMNDIGIDGVTISRGEDYTFIIFKDKTFFNGDSSLLNDQGKTTLDIFSEVVAPLQEGLSQINIMAHTAQGNPDEPNRPRTDRMLSAMRAAEVCIYIQEKDVIQPEKLVNISYGQFRPIASNDTTEGRAKNRRVEILMVDEGADLQNMNKYYEEFDSGVNADTTVVTDGQPVNSDQGFATAEPDSDLVSTTMSPIQDDAGATSAENGFAADGTTAE